MNIKAKLIPIDERNRCRCKICGTNVSVKYRITINGCIETYCNKCVTMLNTPTSVEYAIRKSAALEIIDIINRALPTKEYEGERLALICLIEDKFGISSESEDT